MAQRFLMDPPVSWFGYKPEMQIVLPQIKAAFYCRDGDCRVTSVVRPHDPEKFSLHPFGYAIDAVPDAPWSKAYWSILQQELQLELGTDFQVICHDAGSGMHCHVEFDPQHTPAWTKEKTRLRELWEKAVHPPGPPSSPMEEA